MQKGVKKQALLLPLRNDIIIVVPNPQHKDDSITLICAHSWRAIIHVVVGYIVYIGPCIGCGGEASTNS